MSRAKLFVENFLVYGLINVLNKIIPLILLPVITRMLPDTADFGKFDMFNLVMNFGSKFATLGMYDAMFRMYFEKEDQQFRYNVTTTAQRIVFKNSLLVSGVLIVFCTLFSNLFFGTPSNWLIIIFAAVGVLLTSNQGIIQAPTRIQNKRKIFIFSGLLNSGIYYFLSILLIIVGLSYESLIYSRITSFLVLLVFFWVLNKKFFLKGSYDKTISKELFKLGLPLVPVFLVYWVFNSMDRIMINHFLGTAEVGIYAIGARYAQVSQLIQVAFASGWQYFAFSTMKDSDYPQLIGKIWELLFIVASIFFFIFFMFKDFIFELLFTGSYVRGVEVFPYLLLSPLLLMLYQTLSSQFQVIKKTYYSPIVLSIGALVNVSLNFFMIQSFGIKGASIATVMGYLVVVFFSFILTTKKGLVVFNKKTFVFVIFFLAILVLIFCFEKHLGFLCPVILLYIVLCFVFYYKTFLFYIKKVVKKG